MFDTAAINRADLARSMKRHTELKRDAHKWAARVHDVEADMYGEQTELQRETIEQMRDALLRWEDRLDNQTRH